MLNEIFYCTNTVYVDGTITEDKELYMNGIDHAVKCCQQRLLAYPEIDIIVLLSDNGTKPHIIHR